MSEQNINFFATPYALAKAPENTKEFLETLIKRRIKPSIDGTYSTLIIDNALPQYASSFSPQTIIDATASLDATLRECRDCNQILIYDKRIDSKDLPKGSQIRRSYEECKPCGLEYAMRLEQQLARIQEKKRISPQLHTLTPFFPQPERSPAYAFH